MHEPEEVVLVLHQPANGVERLLVLQPAVHQGPTELVPTVGSDVRRGVQLAEDVRVRVALELHAKRRRAARSFEPEEFHLDGDHTELILESLHDGVVASTGHVKVRGTPSLVRNRENLVRGEQAEGAKWNRDADDNSKQRVGQRFLCEVEARQERQEQENRDYDLADLPPPSGRYEGVQRGHRERREHGHRQRRHRKPAPGAEYLDAQRSWSLNDLREHLRQVVDDETGEQPDHEVAPAAEVGQHHHVDEPDDL